MITGDPDRVIAIEVQATPAPSVEEGDTVRLGARALTASGAEAVDAAIRWASLDTGVVHLTIDSSGLVTGVFAGAGRVQARVGDLRTGAVTITVTGAPDTVALAGPARLAFPAGEEQSPPLATQVSDLTTTPGQSLPLAGKRVRYTLVAPTPGDPASAGFFLTVTDTVPGADPYRVESITAASGQAAAVVRRVAGAILSDSAIVDAEALTAAGAPVPGSPVRFVVVFN